MVRLTQKIASLTAETSKKASTTISTDPSIGEIQAHLKDIKTDIKAMVRGSQAYGLPLPMSRAIDKMMEKALHSALDSEQMQEIFRKLVTTSLSPSPRPSKAESDCGTSSLEDEVLGSNRAPKMEPVRRNRFRRATELDFFATYQSFFGKMYYRSRVIRLEDDAYDEHYDKELETFLTLVSFSWLLKMGIKVACTRSSAGWNHKLSNFNVVKRDAPIFRYSIAGNIAGVKELFSQKLATPWDTNEDGFTVLHLSRDFRNLTALHALTAEARGCVAACGPLQAPLVRRCESQRHELLHSWVSSLCRHHSQG